VVWALMVDIGEHVSAFIPVNEIGRTRLTAAITSRDHCANGSNRQHRLIATQPM
jgi:hypothetical protein